MSTPFAEATAVTALPTGEGASEHRFAVDVHPGWTIGDKPNGGYLLGMLGRAAAACTPHPHPITASAQYVRAPDLGPAVVEIDVLRIGRSASQTRARLLQDGAVCVEALLTLGTLDAAARPFWDAGVPEPGSDEIDRCIRVPGVSPLGVPVPIMDQVELRIERSTLGFGRGNPSGHGVLRGWLGLLDGADFDPFSLLYAVDSFMPATFEIELTGWVPTLALSAFVRALPAPGPVRVLQRAHLVEAQRVDESCWVWDSRGRVVAHATQLAAVRLG